VFLKSLEIFGFKSFADRIKVDFSSGISALLGPNGCGKSNVVDAIKWVVGEQPAGKNTLGIRRGQCGNATHNAGNDLVDE